MKTEKVKLKIFFSNFVKFLKLQSICPSVLIAGIIRKGNRAQQQCQASTESPKCVLRAQRAHSGFPLTHDSEESENLKLMKI